MKLSQTGDSLNRSEASSPAAKACMTAIAVVVWFALALQFYLMVFGSQAAPADRMSLIVNYFSFFTILTNLLVAVGLTLSLAAPRSGWGSFFSQPSARSATAVYISIVGVTYTLLLRHLWNPQGAQQLADILLHDVVPGTYVSYWLIFVRKNSLRWKDILFWLPYPLAYLCYSLIRGAATGWYPYPFIDAGKLGYSRVLVNAAMLVGAFLLVALLAVAIGRRTGHESPPVRQTLE